MTEALKELQIQLKKRELDEAWKDDWNNVVAARHTAMQNTIEEQKNTINDLSKLIG